MVVRQFKELERKDINQPDDLVTVTAAPPEGLSTNEGFKAQGETFQMPASAARQHQRAGFVNIGDSHPGDEVTIRVEAHDNFWDSRKAVEKAQKEAKANAIKDLGGDPPEEVHGQAGLAEADSGDPRMFSGSQSEYEAKVAAAAKGDVQPAVSPSGSHSSTSPVGTSGKGGASAPEGSSEGSKQGTDDYEGMSKADLEKEASKRDDVSASGKNKQQLVDALREDDRK